MGGIMEVVVEVVVVEAVAEVGVVEVIVKVVRLRLQQLSWGQMRLWSMWVVGVGVVMEAARQAQRLRDVYFRRLCDDDWYYEIDERKGGGGNDVLSIDELELLSIMPLH